MNRLALIVALLAGLIVPGTARADIGPVKHWGTFPDREVRAVSFRGGYNDANYAVVQGRDGLRYLRGRWELARMLDDAGHYRDLIETDDCSGNFEAQGVDLRTGVPAPLCDRAADVIVWVTKEYHRHFHAPLPRWTGPPKPTPGDERYLTSVVAAGTDGYWFAFGEVGGVGRLYRSRPAHLLHLSGFGRIEGLAASGEDAYAIGERCRVARLRGTAIVERYGESCGDTVSGRYDKTIVATSDGAVWGLGGTSGVVMRFAPGGTRTRWVLPMSAQAVVVARDGTAYVLGSSKTMSFRYLIAAIRPHRPPDVRVLPMQDAGTMSIDDEDRIWITAPNEHGAAVIAPKGTWR